METTGAQTRDIRRVGVVGLGTMGAGIVEVFAGAGMQVVGVELDEQALERGRGRLQSSADRAVAKGRLTQEAADARMAAVTLAAGLEALDDVDLVVEAVPERMEIKRELFGRLDAIVGPRCILATNTSSLSVTDIAVSTGDPSRVVGMHFFNPAPVQRLVEVVTTVVTDEGVARTIQHLAEALGKTPVVVGDRAGFIANSLLISYLNAAVRLVEQGRAVPQDVDAAMVTACGYPMGPFALMDLIGLDTCRQVLLTMYEETRDPLLAPAPMLTQLVAAGMLGRKTGRGFYDHTAPVTPAAPTAPADPADPAATEAPATGARPPVGTHDQALAEALGLVAGEVDDVGAVLVPAGEELVAASPQLGTRGADVVGIRLVDVGRGTAVAEVVATVASRDAAVDAAVRAVRAAGLVPVRTTDHAGGVVEALLVPYLNDAVRTVQVGYATADDVDLAMRNGCALPQGPFEALDAIGLRRALDLQEHLFAETRQASHAPAPLLVQLVAAGRERYREGSPA